MTWRTPPGIGEELGVNADRVRGWILSGQLAAVNVADGVRPRWRISQEAFDDFLKKRSAVQKLPAPPKRKRSREVPFTEFFPK